MESWLGWSIPMLNYWIETWKQNNNNKKISDWNEVDSAAQLLDMERSKHKFNLIMQQERYN